MSCAPSKVNAEFIKALCDYRDSTSGSVQSLLGDYDFDDLVMMPERLTAANRLSEVVDAITFNISIDFRNAAVMLVCRAATYLRMGKFIHAYIDASEALKLHHSPKGSVLKLPKMHLRRAYYRKYMALKELGLYTTALDNVKKAQRLTDDAQGFDACESDIRSLQGKVDKPRIDSKLLECYNPLFGDSKKFGRETLLGGINQFILNGWKLVQPGQRRIEFDFGTWRSVSDLIELFNERMTKGSSADALKAATLLLSFADDSWIFISAAHMSTDPAVAYAAANISARRAMWDGHIGQVAKAILMKVRALMKAGFYNAAKSALEPLIRVHSQLNIFPEATEIYMELLNKKRDDAETSFETFTSADPWPAAAGLDCISVAQNTKLFFMHAIVELCDIRKNLPDPEDIVQLLRTADLARCREDYNESSRLYTCALSKINRRRNSQAVEMRSYTYASTGGRPLEAYIDACDAIKIDPDADRAYEAKAIALLEMGYVDDVRRMMPKLQRYVDPLRLQANIVDKLEWKKHSPTVPKHMLAIYDSSFADNLGDRRRLTATERQILDELRTVHWNVKQMFDRQSLHLAIGVLSESVQSLPQPGILVMRASLYLAANEYLKAYRDAGEALKLDRYNCEALLLRAKALSSLGQNAKARRVLHTYEGLTTDPTAATEVFERVQGRRDDELPPEVLDELESISCDNIWRDSVDVERLVSTIQSVAKAVGVHVGKDECTGKRALAVEQQLAECVAAVEELIKCNSGQKEQLLDYRKQVQDGEEKTNRLALELDTAMKETNALRSEAAKAKRELQQAHSLIERMQNQCHELNDQLEKVKQNRHAQKADAKKTAALELENKRLKEELNKAEKQVEESEASQGHLRTENAQLRTDQRKALDRLTDTSKQLRDTELAAEALRLKAAELERLLGNEIHSARMLSEQVTRYEETERLLIEGLSRVQVAVAPTPTVPARQRKVADAAGQAELPQSGKPADKLKKAEVGSTLYGIRVRRPPKETKDVEELRSHVYRTVYAKDSGFAGPQCAYDILKEMFDELRIDGEWEAARYRFQSFVEFLQSVGFKGKLHIDSERGTPIRIAAMPNELNMENYEQQQLARRNAEVKNRKGHFGKK